jgi:hypothetical protein
MWWSVLAISLHLLPATGFLTPRFTRVSTSPSSALFVTKGNGTTARPAGFSLDTESTMNKLLMQAQQLREEAAYLDQLNVTNTKNVREDVSGLIRDDVKVEKVINVYINASLVNATSADYGSMVSLLSSREMEGPAIDFVKMIDGIISDTHNETLVSNLLKSFSESGDIFNQTMRPQ